MSKRYDELFGEIVDILRHDWAGAPLAEERFDPRYYNQSIGQAWKDDKLDELLFLRYISQMLACTGDRHLRIARRPSDAYTPWRPGFFARRYENALYVTAVMEQTRLSVGDRIDRINGGSPAAHRLNIQKNFFYAETPEREDWLGLLRMADYIDVTHTDGTSAQIELERFPAGEMPVGSARVVSTAGGTIIDVRNRNGMDEDEIYALLPSVCRADTPAAQLMDTELSVNYTRRNCLVKAASLQGIDGAEEYIGELAEKAGKGYLPESIDDGAVIPGMAAGPVVVLVDTWTRDGAETFALAAKRAGAVLVGRPTLGTIDLCGDVSYELDERYVLTWPTAITKAAQEGNGVFAKGVIPDQIIPWTPAECAEDALMRAAIRYLENK